MIRVRKWLGGSIKAELKRGELLVIVLLAVLISTIWPHVPVWAYFILGFAVSFTQRAAHDVRRWQRRRRAA